MKKLVCPHCGEPTSVGEVLWGTRVKGERSLGSDIGDARILEVPTDRGGKRIYGMMRCHSCRERFVVLIEGKDWVAVYPLRGKIVDANIHERVRNELESVNWCFGLGEYKGCVWGCVTTLEALWRDQKVSGLEGLVERGLVSAELYEKGKEVRLWGDVAKGELVDGVVEEADAEEVVAYLEAILNEVYVEGKRRLRLAQKGKQLKGKR